MGVIKIDQQSIKPGSQAFLELFIARLPSGTEIHLPIHVYRSKVEGPTVLLSGGLHGDEVNGIEIVRRMVAQKTFQKLKKGSVIAIPIINIFGFLNFSRDVPDGKDVNRSFPGNENGSLASLVAHTVSSKLIPVIDFGIDFHTGGASRTNYPQMRYAPNDEKAKEVANHFAAPFTLESGMIEGSLRKCAFDQGKSIAVFEGGESLRFHELSIEEAIKGTQRVLQAYGMLKSAPKPKKEAVVLVDSKWVRADMSGLFRPFKRSGRSVQKDETIGKITDVAGQNEVPVDAPIDGYIIGHNNNPVVHRGDALFHIGVRE